MGLPNNIYFFHFYSNHNERHFNLLREKSFSEVLLMQIYNQNNAQSDQIKKLIINALEFYFISDTRAYTSRKYVDMSFRLTPFKFQNFKQ